jgi:hypothetical protein
MNLPCRPRERKVRSHGRNAADSIGVSSQQAGGGAVAGPVMPVVLATADIKGNALIYLQAFHQVSERFDLIDSIRLPPARRRLSAYGYGRTQMSTSRHDCMFNIKQLHSEGRIIRQRVIDQL